jgi:hypothetical protein
MKTISSKWKDEYLSWKKKGVLFKKKGLEARKRIYQTCRAQKQKKLGNQKKIRPRRRRALEEGH